MKKRFEFVIMMVGIYAGFLTLMALTENVEWIDDVMSDLPLALQILVVSWVTAWSARITTAVVNKIKDAFHTVKEYLYGNKEEETEMIEVAE